MTEEPYTYLFGPVPSRRLGLSLGVDLVPSKTCSLNCVYCESGATTQLTVKRSALVPKEAVMAEIDRYLDTHEPPDAVTFSGAGEPTLHEDLGEIADHIKSRCPGVRVVLLTNGTLFDRKDVRRDAARTDLVIASFDASGNGVFRALNRPHPSLDPEAMAQGLMQFRQEFSGELWIEVFIVPGLNDDDLEVARIAEVVKRIAPHRVQVNTLDRPGAESWVKPADKARLEAITAALGSGEVIGAYTNRPETGVSDADVASRILGMVQRRPCTAEDLAESLAVPRGLVDDALEALMGSGRIQQESQARGMFYKPL
ncbi:radical SAM protein [Desulfoluna spongiiphila]|uniref:Wyosine [tRNA(Phe)-imidazoG37] synthetase, radical SAM superfamily n=1 Tax=Desulfoluna spongiiphila TaxID=419481 RepID=A0A1G5ELK0_9BACT|nr:radical SAM protein [Desulfoluna spongiiphila]SCY27822.1 Wyosine [tRNA(Phe)-imidazoG37] synthetase, radical SAM superfamily [Desulfoluna spongiiphila]